MLRTLRLGSLALLSMGLIAVSGYLGEIKAQEDSMAPSSLTETYQDWVVRCVTPTDENGEAGGPRICEMTQELRYTDSGQLILTLSFRTTSSSPEEANLTIVGPFGLELSEGLRVSVAGERLFTMEFQTCLPRGCFTTLDLDSDQVDVMKTGDQALIEVTTTDQEILPITISLAGFTAGWNRLNSI